MVGNPRDLKSQLEIQRGFHFSFIYILGKTFKIQGMAFKKLCKNPEFWIIYSGKECPSFSGIVELDSTHLTQLLISFISLFHYLICSVIDL